MRLRNPFLKSANEFVNPLNFYMKYMPVGQICIHFISVVSFTFMTFSK